MLLVVAVLYGVWGEVGEAATAIVVIALCIGLEIYTEFRAKRAVNKLKFVRLIDPSFRFADAVAALLPALARTTRWCP
mgnify:CR=1 FL=1